MTAEIISPLTGILQEEHVFVDFGEHEGKSILEIADTLPKFYEYLIDKKDAKQCTIKRNKDKSFRLYVHNVAI